MPRSGFEIFIRIFSEYLLGRNFAGIYGEWPGEEEVVAVNCEPRIWGRRAFPARKGRNQEEWWDDFRWPQE